MMMYQQIAPLPDRMKVNLRAFVFHNGGFLVATLGAVFFLFFCAFSARAAGTICAACQLQVDQQLTFERQGFNATMTITNGLANTSLTNIAVSIYFTDAQGNPVSSTTDPNAT